MKLFLDDMRPEPVGWVVVRSYDAFVRWMQSHEVPEIISFDHDLGREHYPVREEDPSQAIPYDSYKEKTGYHAAQWCVENNKIPALAIVHSFNSAGAKNIESVLAKHTRVLIEPYRGGPDEP